jgi:competence protein ComEC
VSPISYHSSSRLGSQARLPWIALSLAFLVSWQTLFPLPSVAQAVSALAERPLQVTFLDVGQGDALLIRTPEDRFVLVDAGPAGDIAGRLDALEVKRLDLVVASHPHADHIGGMENVLRAIPVTYYMDNGVPHTTDTYLSLMEVLASSGVTYLRAEARTIAVGSMSVEVIPPMPTHPDDHNNASVGLLFRWGSFRILTTGDSESPALQHYLSLGLPTVTAFKAPHHGSRDAASTELLERIRPPVVVISTGRNNAYGHPAPEVIELLRARGSEIFRTDIHGSIQIEGFQDGSWRVHHDR